MDIDLYGIRRRNDIRSNWPSILSRGDSPGVAVDPSRSTTLDGPMGTERVSRADPNRVRDLLSQLIESIEGRPLSDFVPMAQTVPLLLGLTPQNLLAFDEFLGSFIGTVLENGRTVEPGSVTSPSDSISANRRLAAGALGVRRTAVEPGRPRSARKYDDLVAHFSEAKTLAAVLADVDDGLPPAVAEVVGAMLTSIEGNLKSGSPAAAREAGADAATLIVAVHDVFFTEATAERGANCNRLHPVARDHTAGLTGMVRVKKSPRTSRARIKFVEVDGEDVPVDDVVIAGKKFVKRRLRKG